MILLTFYFMLSGVAFMPEGCDIIVLGVALMLEGCDIIDLFCYGVRSGSYAGRL